MSTNYRLFIDTTLYAGNFEMPMCAFLTGVCQHPDRAVEHLDLAREQLSADTRHWFSKNVRWRNGEYGRTPVQIDCTPAEYTDPDQGLFYRTVVIDFKTQPPDDVLQELFTRARTFRLPSHRHPLEQQPKVRAFRLMKITRPAHLSENLLTLKEAS